MNSEPLSSTTTKFERSEAVKWCVSVAVAGSAKRVVGRRRRCTEDTQRWFDVVAENIHLLVESWYRGIGFKKCQLQLIVSCSMSCLVFCHHNNNKLRLDKRLKTNYRCLSKRATAMTATTTTTTRAATKSALRFDVASCGNSPPFHFLHERVESAARLLRSRKPCATQQRHRKILSATVDRFTSLWMDHWEGKHEAECTLCESLLESNLHAEYTAG